MFVFEKRTQIPVCIKNRNPRLAGIILEQYGGADGELSASLRYLSQRFTMPDNMGKGLLTDIGTEELAHRWYQQIQKPPIRMGGFLKRIQRLCRRSGVLTRNFGKYGDFKIVAGIDFLSAAFCFNVHNLFEDFF